MVSHRQLKKKRRPVHAGGAANSIVRCRDALAFITNDRCLPATDQRNLQRLAVKPAIDILSYIVLCLAIALLDYAFQLFALARYDIKIVVSELAPLFLDLALDLFPVTFDAVPVHDALLVVAIMTRTF